MYKINIELFSDRKIKMTSASAGVTGENNGTELIFKIPSEYASYTKYLDIFRENGDILQTVVSISDENEFTYLLPGMFSEHLNVYMQLVLKKGNEVFKSYRFVLTFEEGINATEYLESEFQDSIQHLYETKADKSEVAKLEKSIENKLTFKMFADEKRMILDLLDTKADRTSVPTRLSELHDDSGNVPIKNAVNAKNADACDSAVKDANGNLIHETYATQERVDEVEKLANLIYEIEDYAKIGKTSLSQLVDDTTKSDYKVNYALNSVFSEHAMFADNAAHADRAALDGVENVIHETYATKAELLEAIGEALEGDY